jgi:hypothetical protein
MVDVTLISLLNTNTEQHGDMSESFMSILNLSIDCSVTVSLQIKLDFHIGRSGIGDASVSGSEKQDFLAGLVGGEDEPQVRQDQARTEIHV